MFSINLYKEFDCVLGLHLCDKIMSVQMTRLDDLSIGEKIVHRGYYNCKRFYRACQRENFEAHIKFHNLIQSDFLEKERNTENKSNDKSKVVDKAFERAKERHEKIKRERQEKRLEEEEDKRKEEKQDQRLKDNLNPEKMKEEHEDKRRAERVAEEKKRRENEVIKRKEIEDRKRKEIEDRKRKEIEDRRRKDGENRRKSEGKNESHEEAHQKDEAMEDSDVTMSEQPAKKSKMLDYLIWCIVIHEYSISRLLSCSNHVLWFMLMIHICVLNLFYLL